MLDPRLKLLTVWSTTLLFFLKILISLRNINVVPLGTGAVFTNTIITTPTFGLISPATLWPLSFMSVRKTFQIGTFPPFSCHWLPVYSSGCSTTTTNEKITFSTLTVYDHSSSVILSFPTFVSVLFFLCTSKGVFFLSSLLYVLYPLPTENYPTLLLSQGSSTLSSRTPSSTGDIFLPIPE